jgi:hypothetical protein
MKAFLGFLLAIAIIGLVVSLFCFESWILMLLINWLVPIFFPSFIGLSLGQACGLNLIASILFGGGGITIKSRKD